MKCAVIVHIGWNAPYFVEADSPGLLFMELDNIYWLRETGIMNYEDESFESPDGVKLLDWIEDFMIDARMEKFDKLQYLFTEDLIKSMPIKCIAWAEGEENCKALKERFERDFN